MSSWIIGFAIAVVLGLVLGLKNSTKGYGAPDEYEKDEEDDK